MAFEEVRGDIDAGFDGGDASIDDEGGGDAAEAHADEFAHADGGARDEGADEEAGETEDDRDEDQRDDPDDTEDH
jgi:hypothetical protein